MVVLIANVLEAHETDGQQVTIVGLFQNQNGEFISGVGVGVDNIPWTSESPWPCYRWCLLKYALYRNTCMVRRFVILLCYLSLELRSSLVKILCWVVWSDDTDVYMYVQWNISMKLFFETFMFVTLTVLGWYLLYCLFIYLSSVLYH